MNSELKIIRYIPQIYQAQEKSTLLSLLLTLFAQELEEIENDTKGVIASHTVDFADNNGLRIDDLARLGALFSIKPKLQEKIEEFRERLKETVKLYLDGLSTAEAVIRMTAIHFGYKINYIERPTIERAFSTTAELEDKEGHLYEIEVRDNPPQLVSERKGAVTGENWDLYNDGLFAVNPAIVISAAYKTLVNPQITNFTTGWVIGYRGIIPKNKSLVITFDEGLRAHIGGRDVSEDIFRLKGESFDIARFDQSRFAEEGESARDFELPSGRSNLHYTFSAGRIDFATFDYASFHKQEVGEFDESWWSGQASQIIFATAPDVELTFSWYEQRMGTFWLKLPYELFQKEIAFFKEDITRSILSDVKLVKAAGVKSIIYLLYGYDENDHFREPQILRDELPLFKIKFYLKETMSPTDNEVIKAHIVKSRIMENQRGNDELSFKGVLDLAPIQSQILEDRLSLFNIKSQFQEECSPIDRLSAAQLVRSSFSEGQTSSDQLTFRGVFNLTRFNVSTF